MTDDDINEIIAKLNEATNILTKTTAFEDIDITEWNQTPIGQAVRRIADAIEMLEELPND